MRQRVVTCGLVGAIAAWASMAGAQPAPPSQPPTTDPSATSRLDRPSRFDGRTGYSGRRFLREEAPTSEEWTPIEAFMKENSPVRLEMLKRIEDSLGGTDRPISLDVRRRMAYRYNDLEAMKRRGSEIYPFALKRVQIEDEVMGSLRDLRSASDAEKPKLEKQLLERVRRSVDNTLDERRVRLEQLKAAIDRETKALANDEQDVDKLVDAQRVKFEKEMAAMLDFGKTGNPPAPTTQVAADGR